MKYILILCLATVVFSCKERSVKTSSHILHKNTSIAYTDCGDADTTLFFVHGWCINKEYWEPQFTAFCGRYRVVAVDLPGFGQSGKNRNTWSFEEYTNDIKAVIEQLELRNVILIGHSMSGDIVLHADNSFPSLLAGIVGIDNLHEPAGVPTPEQQKEMAMFFDMMSADFDSTVSKYMRPSLFQPTTSKEVVERVMNNVFAADSSIAIKTLRALSDFAPKEKALMQGLSHKLYLVNSDVQPVNKDSLVKYCAKGYFTAPVSGTGHYPMIEKPAEFNQALQQVLDAIATKQ